MCYNKLVSKAQGDIDELWNIFADKISSTYKDNIPVSKSMTKKFNTPWMNEVTLNSLIKKRKLWKKCPLNKNNYDEAKRSANYHVRQAKYEYEYERSIATNMKEDNKIFWKFIQSKTKSKENIPCKMDENGELQMDNKIKAELLNKFFQSVFRDRTFNLKGGYGFLFRS